MSFRIFRPHHPEYRLINFTDLMTYIPYFFRDLPEVLPFGGRLGLPAGLFVEGSAYLSALLVEGWTYPSALLVVRWAYPSSVIEQQRIGLIFQPWSSLGCIHPSILPALRTPRTPVTRPLLVLQIRGRL